MDHVNEHCNLHKLLPDYQSAYQNGYSCETAIIRLANNILWAMENQNVTAVMALDLSAAFHTVDHEILSSVLEHNFGLEHTVLNWFNSYLNHRSCKINTRKRIFIKLKPTFQHTSRFLCRCTALQLILQLNTGHSKPTSHPTWFCR